MSEALRLQNILEKLVKRSPKANLELIERAYVYSAKVHMNQVRLSGEPFLSHPLYVANLLADHSDDVVCIACGLLHDVLEDTPSSEQEIENIFGIEVKELISNLHKFVIFDSRQFRKDSIHAFLVDYFIQDEIDCESGLIRNDPRILLIRMADCIHNTLMLPYMQNPSYKEWFLQQNLNFRVPLAKKMGFAKIARLLEEMSHAALRALESRTPLVFLCYAKEDKRKIDKIYKFLMGAGFRPWMDKPPKPYDMAGIKPGQNWDQTIRQMISDADYIVACLSKISVSKKGYVQREYRRALQIMNETPVGHVMLIPALLEECDVPDIQVEQVHFKDLQWFELYKKSLDDLVCFIREDHLKRSNKSCS